MSKPFQIASWANGRLDSEYRLLLTPHGRAAGTSQNWMREVIRKCLTTANYRVIILRDYKTSAGDTLLELARSICIEFEFPVHAPKSSRRIDFRNSGSTIQVAGTERNTSSLKGLLDLADLVFFEEAETLSEESWIIAEPTIRKPGSKIILNWNPQIDTEICWQLYSNPPPRTFRQFLTYRNNPWLPEEIRDNIAWATETANATLLAAYNGDWPIAGQMFDISQVQETDDLRFWLGEATTDRQQIIGIDTAWSEGQGDYSWFSNAVKGPDGSYLLRNVEFGQWNPYNLRQHLRNFMLAHCRHGVIELAPGSQGWIDDTKREFAADGLLLTEVSPAGKTKAERASLAATITNAGLLYIPKNAPWWPALRNQMSAFPSKNVADDGIDSLAYAINHLAQLPSGRSWYI